MRKVIVILMVLIALGLMAADIAAAEDNIPFPPDNDKCDNSYILKWTIPECLYCEGIGDYYLFSCYDSNNTNLILKHVCVYPTNDGDTIITDASFNSYLPMIYGMNVIIGIPVSK